MFQPVVTDVIYGSEKYQIERYDQAQPSNRWRLIYPNGEYQRTRNKRDAMRLAELHATDNNAWSKEVKGRKTNDVD